MFALKIDSRLLENHIYVDFKNDYGKSLRKIYEKF